MCFEKGGVLPLLGAVLGDSPPRQSMLPPNITSLLRKRGVVEAGSLMLPPKQHRLYVVNGGIILNKISYGLYIVYGVTEACKRLTILLSMVAKRLSPGKYSNDRLRKGLLSLTATFRSS